MNASVAKRGRGSAHPTRRPRRAGPARRAGEGAARTTELRALRTRLGEIDARLTTLRRPLHEVLSLIGEVKAPLGLPPLIIRRLGDAITALKALRIVTTGLSWVPGPIGVGARAADRAIAPLVASPPPPRGVLGNARDTVAEIDRLIAPVRDAIGKVEKPLSKAAGRIDAVHAKVLSLIALADALLAHYGDAPPPGVEACAARINAPLAAFLDGLERIEARLAPALARLLALLGTLKRALEPLSDIAGRLETLLKTLGSSAFQAVLKPLRRLVSALEPYRRLAEWMVRRILDRILKSIGISLKSIENAFARMIGAIDPVKRLAAEVEKLKARLAETLAALRQALGIDALLADLEALGARAEAEIDAFLRSACGTQMMPPRPPAARAVRARAVRAGAVRGRGR